MLVLCFVVSCTTKSLFICLFVLKEEDFIINEADQAQAEKSKTCKFTVKRSDRTEWTGNITIEPTDTVETLVEKMAPSMIEDEFVENNACVMLKFRGMWITTGNNKSKSLKELHIYDEGTVRFVVISFGRESCKKRSCTTIQVTSKQEKMDLGKLPLYEVVSVEDATNPGKKHNQFQETGKFVELSKGRKLVKYNGFNLGSKIEPYTLEATNPLERFICSDHLKKQYAEGRLMNAEKILERKIGGFNTILEEGAQDNGAGKIDEDKYQEVASQNGWQGINTAEYIKPYAKGSIGIFKLQINDVERWYGKLSDILLDKAYLSYNKNLDVLISAADKLYDANKITLEQFANLALMLHYAYELRRLPNEKGGKLNSDIEPIQLDEHSQKVLAKILDKINNELYNLCQVNGYVKDQRADLGAANNKLNEKLENNEGEVVVNNEYPSLDVDKEDNKSSKVRK